MGLEDGQDLGFGNVEAESFHGDFELVIVNFLIVVEVEEMKLIILSVKLLCCMKCDRAGDGIVPGKGGCLQLP